MVDLGFDTECLKKRDAAKAENGLLAEAVVCIAPVKMVSQLAVPGIISFDITVEQEDGDDVTGGSDYVISPGAKLDLPVLYVEGEGMTSGRKALRGPGDIGFVCCPTSESCCRKYPRR